jgi:hypothetical protein
MRRGLAPIDRGAEELKRRRALECPSQGAAVRAATGGTVGVDFTFPCPKFQQHWPLIRKTL